MINKYVLNAKYPHGEVKELPIDWWSYDDNKLTISYEDCTDNCDDQKQMMVLLSGLFDKTGISDVSGNVEIWQGNYSFNFTNARLKSINFGNFDFSNSTITQIEIIWSFVDFTAVKRSCL